MVYVIKTNDGKYYQGEHKFGISLYKAQFYANKATAVSRGTRELGSQELFNVIKVEIKEVPEL